MDYRKLHKEMYRRKSVRKYQSRALPKARMEEIKAFVERLPSLQPDVEVGVEIVSRGKMGNVFGVEAPYYALFYTDLSDSGKLEAGFRVQALSLLITGNGHGNCILGMAKPLKELRVRNGQKWTITLAFGIPAEGIHRQAGEFNRKPLDKVADHAIPQLWREALRVAPSAVNGQPWYFTGSGKAVHCHHRMGQGVVKSLLAGSYYLIDMGIAIFHLFVAVRLEEKNCVLAMNTPPVVQPKGCTYLCTVKVA